ncbi:MAG: ABC transporter ATP-binding protein [Candidatus Bathyarchaeota archaeon]|nr:ABC transporter ATP-binding protein [Candidatus Bathyarchaeota archaeon]
MRNRPESIKIYKFRRTYDKKNNRFKFCVEYETRAQVTERTIEIAEAFGLGIDDAQKFPVLNAELHIKPQDIVYITGDSGSGKSVLLRGIRADLGTEALEMSEVKIDPEKPIIETVGDTIEQAIELLSKVGLNDAFLFLRKYSQLSDGQRFRYRLAKFLESKKQWLIADEFAATLDRDTAKIVAYNLQKLARQQGKAVIVATTHDDLTADLSPSVLVRKRFGEEIDIKYYPNTPAAECSLIKEMKVERGALEDWQKLSNFHYRSHNTSARRAIFCIRRKDELCAVIVYCYPFPQCAGRSLVLPKMDLKELNQKLSIISRIVVHPKYRTIGLGEKLIRDSLPLAGTPHVEMIAVMPKYNPFAEHAGMKKILVKEPPKAATNVTAELEKLGLDLRFLGSQRYVIGKLQSLSTSQLTELRAVFVHNGHPMFREALGAIRHKKGEPTNNYPEELEKANIEKLAKLIKIATILLQTKVYLFWSQ